MKMKILKEYDDRILYITEKCVASGSMNDGPEITSFEDSSLYAWLNGEFAQNFLSEEEQDRLLEVTLLSAEEAALFFPEEAMRGCRPDETAVSEGVRIGGNGNVWWWLRDTGFADDFFQIVDFAGHICSQGTYQTLTTNGIRPAIWLKKVYSASFSSSFS